MKPAIFKYGCLAPLELPDAAGDVLFRANRLWNALVEIERESRAAANAVLGSAPEAAAATAEAERLSAEMERLQASRKAAKTGRGNRDLVASIAAQIASLAPELRTARAVAKEARKAAVEGSRDALRAIETRRKERVKTARNPEQSGLWWGHYNAVCAAYDTARSRAMKTGTQLQFHRFDGSGRWVNQIQGGITWEELVAGKACPVSIVVHPPRGTGKRTRIPTVDLSITLNTSGQRGVDFVRNSLTLRMLMHRPLPPHCRIQEVTITRRRIGSDWRYEALFLVRTEEPTERTGARAAGIDIGWRETPDGLRVATIATPAGHVHHHIDPDWIRRMERCETLRSLQDQAATTEAARVIAAWPSDDGDPLIEYRRHLAITASRHPARALYRLAIAARDRYGSDVDAPEWMPGLEQWRRQHRLWREEESNLRDKLIAHRRDRYRKLAAELCATVDTIGMDAMRLDHSARLINKDGSETTLAATARRNRVYAAPSELRTAIESTAARTGVRVIRVSGPTTSCCHLCGRLSDVPADALIHRCPSCNAVWDRDANAAILRQLLCERSSDAPQWTLDDQRFTLNTVRATTERSQTDENANTDQ